VAPAKSKTDAQMIARLEREAPEVLEREVDFDALVERVLIISPNVSGTTQQRRKHKRKRTTNTNPKQ
jgi:hypothetical protein